MRVANLDEGNNSYREDSWVIETVRAGEECRRGQSISRALMTRQMPRSEAHFLCCCAHRAAAKLIAVRGCVSCFLASLSFRYQR